MELSVSFTEDEKIRILERRGFVIKSLEVEESVYGRTGNPIPGQHVFVRYKFVFDNGVQIGTLEEIFKEKASDYLKRFLYNNM